MILRVSFICFISLFIAGLCAQSLRAEDNLNLRGFASLPILHEGRVKPMDSFARIIIKTFTKGHETVDGQPASEILAHILFDPVSAAEMPIITVQHKALREQLGLEQKTVSYTRLRQALSAKQDDIAALLTQEDSALTPDQRALVRAHDDMRHVDDLMRSLSLILPLYVELPEGLQDDIPSAAPPTYIDLARHEKALEDRVKAIIQKKGMDPTLYTAEEQQITALSFQLAQIGAAGHQSTLLKVIPSDWSAAHGRQNAEWNSPWETLLSGDAGPDTGVYIQAWRNVAGAYRAQDAAQWNAGIDALSEIYKQGAITTPMQQTLAAEYIYRNFKPFYWASGLYVLAALCLVGSLRVRLSRLRGAGVLLAWAGAGAHIAGIAMRVYIMDRPPIGTLYESVLFTALICAVLGLWIGRQSAGKPAGVQARIVGVIAAFGLLFLAPVTAPNAEDLEVLVAVLNTNFWLATHVTIITAGYGICVLAALLAHLYLGQRLIGSAPKAALKAQYDSAYKISIAALLFTAVGTVLGGIWADQSWGRFWGWDPKENGALLIVLWLIWIQHGRLSGWLRDVPFMAMLAVLNIIVALAWFGVNLLGVRLHSYGFTSGMAAGLGIFCAIEVCLIAVLWAGIRISERRRLERI